MERHKAAPPIDIPRARSLPNSCPTFRSSPVLNSWTSPLYGRRSFDSDWENPWEEDKKSKRKSKRKQRHNVTSPHTPTNAHRNEHIQESSVRSAKKSPSQTHPARYHSVMREDGSHYQGEMEEGMKHGQGVLVDQKGNRYEGQWVQDRAEGYGRKVFTNGDVHEGYYRRDKRNGFGTYMWQNGDSYVGQWCEGKMEGKGKFDWNTKGDTYEGLWSGGMMEGKGVKRMSNGDVYNGQWSQDKAQGWGCKQFSCGDIHEGEYKKDERDGFGVYYWKCGDRFEGFWSNGEMHGRGYKHTIDRIYMGEWKNSKPHGNGIMLYSNRETYQGKYENGLRHGQGIYVWEIGARYNGQWLNGLIWGSGVFTHDDFGEYQGQWRDQRPHGIGHRLYSDGEQYVGKFRLGKRHGEGIQLWRHGIMYRGQWMNGNPHGEGVFVDSQAMIAVWAVWHQGTPSSVIFIGKARNQKALESFIHHPLENYESPLYKLRKLLHTNQVTKSGQSDSKVDLELSSKLANMDIRFGQRKDFAIAEMHGEMSEFKLEEAKEGSQLALQCSVEDTNSEIPLLDECAAIPPVSHWDLAHRDLTHERCASQDRIAVEIHEDESRQSIQFGAPDPRNIFPIPNWNQIPISLSEILEFKGSNPRFKAHRLNTTMSWCYEWDWLQLEAWRDGICAFSLDIRQVPREAIPPRILPIILQKP